MEAEAKFKIIYKREALKFLASIPIDARQKMTYIIGQSMYNINPKFFKKLSGSNIWEFRASYNNISYRLFAFWDTDGKTLVIATHGIIKKTQKTPTQEIKKAEDIRKEWFKNK